MTTTTTFADAASAESPSSAVAGAGLGDSLQRLLLQAVAEAADREAAARNVAQVLALVLRPTAVWRRSRDPQAASGWSDPVATLEPRDETKLPIASLDTACQEAAQRASVVHLGHQQGLPCALLAAPVICRGEVAEVMLAAIPWEHHDAVRSAAQLQMGALALTLRELLGSAGQLESASQLQQAALETVRVLLGADDLPHAAALLANHLAAVVPCGVVGVAQCGGRGESRLLTVSGVAKLDRHGELARGFEAVMDETVAARAAITYSTDPNFDSTAGAAARSLCAALDAQALTAAPLLDEQGQAVAAWVVVGAADVVRYEPSLDSLRELVQPLLARLHQQQQATVLRTRLRRAAGFLRSRPGVAAVIAGVLLAMLCPWPYHVGCDATLEPVVRRYVVAPYEGILEKQLVERGDLVRRGQLLARMDGRQLRMKLSALRADLSREEKTRDAARAEGNVAEMQISALEVERLRQELQLAEHRWENLEIRSPLDGIIVSGDLEQAEGAPLEQGQSLYEVSPLDEMVVEALIPEDQVRHVAAGAPARVWLDAFPNQPWTGVVERIHPRTEMRDNESVFVAEVRLDNSRRLLRPGMNGRARLRGPVRPVAWNLFHRAWERLLAKLGW